MPLRDNSFGQDWLIAIRSGNWLMAAFALTLGSTTSIMAGRLGQSPSEASLLANYPGWRDWLPLFGDQCIAFMRALRQGIDSLVDPSGADAAGYRVSSLFRPDVASVLISDRARIALGGYLQSDQLFEASNPLSSLASASLQLHIALLLEAPPADCALILRRGESVYFASTGMAVS